MRLRSFCFAFLSAAMLAPASVATASNVLILASRDSLQPAYEQFMSGFRSVLGARGEVELFTEFLDSPRFPEPEHRQRTLRLLREKYQAKQIDLVVTTSPPAFNYLLEHRRELFPAAPHVFALVSALELPARPLAGDVIGVLDRFDPVKTLELARALQPKAQRLAIVSGADAFDRMWEGIARRDLQPTLGGMEFIYLSGLPLSRLLEEVAGLPTDTIVLYLSVLRDGDGQILRAPEVLQKLSAASGNPTYGLFPSYLGTGMVGGYLNSFEAVGEHTAAIVLRLLSGEKPERVRAELAGPEGAYTVDWRQMQRWDLSAARLPAGSVVRFRQASLWEEHRRLILAGGALLLLQAALISALLVQRGRRRRAELAAHQRSMELAHSLRLATIGEMTAAISHEINQPLGAILGNAEAAEMLLDADAGSIDELRKILADIRRDNLRATEVVRRVRAFLQKQEAERRAFDPGELVSDTLHLLEAEAARRGVALEVQAAPGMRVRGDRIQLQHLLINLVMNAMDAMADTHVAQRKVVVRLSQGQAGTVEIAVSDAGHGIEPGAGERLFESFFTTKPQGLGLGLSIARTIAEAHGGVIRAENNPSGGATFRVALPEAGTA